jgi:adenosylcobyric acid synthase
MSNFTDADALAAEPGVRVRFTRSIADVERADLVVVPGTKATVEDLGRLRRDGLDRALAARAAAGDPIFGICGGYQLLGERIDDEVESRRGAVDGLGLLPVTTTFAPDKLLRRPTGFCDWLGTEVGGYEIRHGRPERHGGEALIRDEGCRVGDTIGLSWHGALEHDAFRRALLLHVAGVRARRFVPGTTPFADVRAAHLDTLGDLIAEHVDTARLAELIEDGPPAGLPTLETKVLACSAS